MIEVKLAKACRRRLKGAPMTVNERAAYHMMMRGEAVLDEKFAADFAREKRLPLPVVKKQKSSKKKRSKKP